MTCMHGQTNKFTVEYTRHYYTFLSYMQVEGAFIQGMGLVTMEQCIYLEGDENTERGQVYTTGASTYKIPSCTDIPVQLNVTLLDRAPNPKAIFSSKVSWGCSQTLHLQQQLQCTISHCWSFSVFQCKLLPSYFVLSPRELVSLRCCWPALSSLPSKMR